MCDRKMTNIWHDNRGVGNSCNNIYCGRLSVAICKNVYEILWGFLVNIWVMFPGSKSPPIVICLWNPTTSCSLVQSQTCGQNKGDELMPGYLYLYLEEQYNIVPMNARLNLNVICLKFCVNSDGSGPAPTAFFEELNVALVSMKLALPYMTLRMVPPKISLGLFWLVML